MAAAAPHLQQLGAGARPAGSAAADEARRYCAGVLRAAGFSVAEQPFEYSQFSGRWAAPVAGFVVPLAASAIVLIGRSEVSMRGLALVAAIVAIVIAAALRYAGGGGVLDLPILRARGVNLRAVRGDAAPRIWLVAHIDSKWQPVSMLARVAGVAGLAIGVAGVVVCVFAFRSMDVAPIFAGVAWLGGIPLILSIVGVGNHGTLDNASGVASVLAAAALVPRECVIGVMVTDAEELALAGARAWARIDAPAIALNCDSVDDSGALTVMYTGTRPARVVDALESAARSRDERLRIIRLIPGILTDSVALANAGWKTVTLSRGDLRTLQRIHTRGDTLAAMHGTGVSLAADVLARAALELS